jgi:hypothetical protein
MKKLLPIVFVVVMLLSVVSCDPSIGEPNVAAAFLSAVQSGGSSGTADSTALTLTFDVDPTSLAAGNITVTGATKGELTGSGTTRTLAISDIVVGDGETVSVAIASPSGFTISGSPKTAVVYTDTRVAVAFLSAEQTGGASGSVDSTALTLTFDVDPTSLAAGNITVTGATKGELTGSGTTRTLAISDIVVGDGETVSVAIASPSGFTLSGSPKTAVVYKGPSIGTAYQGGIIAYILQSGDPGFVSGEFHGLIAATADQSTGIQWYNGLYIVTGATGTELGTGQANTTAIIAMQGTGSYAAQVCDDYTNTDTGTGVYSDWYLPSKDALIKLYLNKTAIGGFSGIYYWSSSEDDQWHAVGKYFNTGNPSVGYKHYADAHVRPVRTF